MFTGLVAGMATVQNLIPEPPGLRLRIAPPEIWRTEPYELGESVALNGCCLTLVAVANGMWDFQAGPETLARTNLGRLQAGDAVNVERPMQADGKFGGHIVQGHVDGVGRVDKIEESADWTTMWFFVPSRLTRYMVGKGSVTVDGISLTLVRVERNRFSVALIPHTLQATTLGRRKVGEAVNIEVDVLAKYVEKLLAGHARAH